MRIKGLGQVDPGGEHVVRVETGVDAQHLDEAADEQSRGDQQHQTDGGFGDDQPIVEEIAAAPAGHTTGAFAKRQRGIEARHAPRRDQSEEEAGQNGNRDGESQNGRVDGDLVEARQFLGHEPDQQVENPGGEENTERAAREREQQGFEQDLAHDGESAGADGGAQGHFGSAPGGARQHEAGDVGASDQEHQGHGREEDP